MDKQLIGLMARVRDIERRIRPNLITIPDHIFELEGDARVDLDMDWVTELQEEAQRISSEQGFIIGLGYIDKMGYFPTFHPEVLAQLTILLEAPYEPDEYDDPRLD